MMPYLRCIVSSSTKVHRSSTNSTHPRPYSVPHGSQNSQTKTEDLKGISLAASSVLQLRTVNLICISRLFEQNAYLIFSFVPLLSIPLASPRVKQKCKTRILRWCSLTVSLSLDNVHWQDPVVSRALPLPWIVCISAPGPYSTQITCYNATMLHPNKIRFLPLTSPSLTQPGT